MTSQKSRRPEILVEKLLHDLGAQGILYEDLTEEDVEEILSNAPSVTLSKLFQQRARTAMRDAQIKRATNLPSSSLGNQAMYARQQAGLEVKDISQEVGVPISVIEAFEAGQLKPSQIMHNFPAATMLQLLRRLQIQLRDFTTILMDIVEIMGSFSDFTETQAAYRKHAPNNTDLVVEVAEYIAHLERLDK